MPPHLRTLVPFVLTFFFLLSLTPSQAFPITAAQQSSSNSPVITTDFADPSIIHVDGIWYAFATQSIHDHQDIRTQLATSTDFETWTLTGKDAMGTLAPWVDPLNPQVWAPDVYKREDGTFILYYSAKTTDDGRFHCVGTAVSDSVEGPYHSNSDTPFACPLDRGGAIDASAFKNDDGTRYVLYKIDGNAIGHGGSCNNMVEPLVSTPIMIQQVGEDWTTPVGEAAQILDRGEHDGPLIEAPAMIKKRGAYYLFFSSNCYITALYDTSYATSTASKPTEGFVKARFPLLIQGTLPGVAGPGHADIAYGGVHMAFHAYATYYDVGGRRSMFVKTLDVGGEIVALSR